MSNPHRVRALILDVDGTILDSNRLHAEAWAAALTAHGRPVTAAEVLPHIGKGSDKLVSAVAPDLPPDVAEKVRADTGPRFARLAHDRGVPQLPGVDALVREARARSLRVAIASSAKREDFDTLGKTSGVDLEALADVVVLGDDVEATKPDPDIVEAAIAKLALPPHECVMVGDTPYDAEAARRAGARAVGLLTGVHDEATLRRAGAEWVFRDLAALAANLDQVIGS
jgi:HAD superfamily hydrolase (TIGR01509 family)